MERLYQKLAKRYEKAKEETRMWDDLQSQILSLFSKAAAILERMPVLRRRENYGLLNDVSGMTRDLPGKQVESLESIFVVLHKTLGHMLKVLKALERIWKDVFQLLKAEKLQLTQQGTQQYSALRLSPNECLEGLKSLYDMHKDEYSLKVSIISSLLYNTSLSDLVALQTLLADQPNIPKDEVQFIFDSFFAGEST